jgi:transcriptional regulator with GAF, ATPase, and Fis domain
VESYADMLGMESATLLGAIRAAREAASEDPALSRAVAAPAKAVASQETPHEPARTDATPLLVRGVADMRNVSPGTSLSQLMTMALETSYQGLHLKRAVVFLRHRKEGKYVASMVFGDETSPQVQRLGFDDAYQPDVFHAALANDKMVCVKDAQDPAFRAKLPRWWKEAFPSVRSFIVLPLTANRQPVGFLYGDWGDAMPVSLSNTEILALNELRTLVMRREGA